MLWITSHLDLVGLWVNVDEPTQVNGNRYAAGQFSRVANLELPYGPLELYFAGYLPPEEVPDLWIAAGGDWVTEDGSDVTTGMAILFSPPAMQGSTPSRTSSPGTVPASRAWPMPSGTSASLSSC